MLSAFSHESRVVTLDCVEGWDQTSLFEGVAVIDLLEASNLSPDATTVVFAALDGYTTSLPLSAVRDRRLLLAYRVNNVTLPRSLGFPFILVAEDRWVQLVPVGDGNRGFDGHGLPGLLGSGAISNDGDVSNRSASGHTPRRALALALLAVWPCSWRCRPRDHVTTSSSGR